MTWETVVALVSCFASIVTIFLSSLRIFWKIYSKTDEKLLKISTRLGTVEGQLKVGSISPQVIIEKLIERK